MNLAEPIVALVEGHEGLSAAAWLAANGHAVRVLCRGSLQGMGAVEPLLAGEQGRLDPVLGATRPTDARPVLHWRDRVADVPRRRRAVAGLGAVGTLQLARELWNADRRLSNHVDGWGARRFGPTAWSRVVRPVLEARLGGDPGGLHRGLGPLLTCRPDGPWRTPTRSGKQRLDACIESIRAAGGDVLEEVHVTAIEIERGRMVGVVTGHGLEHAGTLVTDLAVARLAALLPPVPDAEVHALESADLVTVEVRAENDLPPVVLLAGQATRIVRALDDGGALSPDTLWLSLCGARLADEPDAILEARARSAAFPLIEAARTGAIVRVPQGVPRPDPTTEGIVFRWLQHLAGLGILPVGPRALYVPMLPRDVVDTTVAVLDGISAISVRGGRLGLTPTSPWMLVQ